MRISARGVRDSQWPTTGDARLAPRLTVAGLVLTLALGGVTSMHAARQSMRHALVTVLTDTGDVVHGLTRDDFLVQIDGETQEILRVAPATTPLSVAILTDQLGIGETYAPQDVRSALSDFVSTIRRESRESTFSLTTFDGSIRPVTPFESGPTMLDRALSRLVGAGEDAFFLDALDRVTRRNFPTERRAILAVLGSYRQDHSRTHTDNLGDALRDSGASLWAVEAVQHESGSYHNAPRELVLETATLLSGGTRDTVTSRQQLSSALARIARRMLAQYDVTYGPGQGTTRSRLTIGVRRTRALVLAPSWLAVR